MNLIEHMTHAIAFSRSTWGPGQRRAGLISHIKKELHEIENDPDDGLASNEWVDVVILALDGLWRELYHELDGPEPGRIAEIIAVKISGKQKKNEGRTWPDWRTQPPGKAIEHVRNKDDV